MSVINYFSEEAMAEAGITWQELLAIRKDFKRKVNDYEQTAEGITNVLLKTLGVHSGRYRVKNLSHLIEKVARKRHADRDRVITVDNYEQEITDLAGVRVLHLFKSDWQSIHKYITETWALHEKPTAYYRNGDSAEVLDMFTKQECNVREHPAGYRSVHYIIETALTKTKRLVEIQVRTIFEEGWSEVDHKLRYPNFSDDPLTKNFLSLLNRLAGSADEMSSLVQELHQYLVASKDEAVRTKQEHEAKVKQMQQVIDDLNLSTQDKSRLQGAAEALGGGSSTTLYLKPGIRWMDMFSKQMDGLKNEYDPTSGSGSLFVRTPLPGTEEHEDDDDGADEHEGSSSAPRE